MGWARAGAKGALVRGRFWAEKRGFGPGKFFILFLFNSVSIYSLKFEFEISFEFFPFTLNAQADKTSSMKMQKFFSLSYI
jgi:CTP-dependent riboflavin kinase